MNCSFSCLWNILDLIHNAWCHIPVLQCFGFSICTPCYRSCSQLFYINTSTSTITWYILLSVAGCGTPENIPGSIIPHLQSTSSNSVFIFECQKLYFVTGRGPLGDNRVVCDKFGRWDFGSLDCVRK